MGWVAAQFHQVQSWCLVQHAPVQAPDSTQSSSRSAALMLKKFATRASGGHRQRVHEAVARDLVARNFMKLRGRRHLVP